MVVVVENFGARVHLFVCFVAFKDVSLKLCVDHCWLEIIKQLMHLFIAQSSSHREYYDPNLCGNPSQNPWPSSTFLVLWDLWDYENRQHWKKIPEFPLYFCLFIVTLCSDHIWPRGGLRTWLTMAANISQQWIVMSSNWVPNWKQLLCRIFYCNEFQLGPKLKATVV